MKPFLLVLSALAGLLPLAARSLDLDTGKPAAGWSVGVTDFEGEARLPNGSASVRVPKPAAPRVPDSHVAARRGDDGTLTLQFSNSWIAQLRWQDGAALNLNPYLAQGTVEFDLNVLDLAHGGMKFKLGCGKDCERKVPFLFAGRALAGKGRQHISLALSCFWRQGDDFSAVNVPFTLEGTGSGELQISQLRFNKIGKPNTACPDYRTQSVTPEPLQESWAVEWWMPRHEQKLAEVKAHQQAGRRVDLVFMGDSITQGWEKEGQQAWAQHFAKYNAVALGFGGDRTENLLWRLQHGEIDGMSDTARPPEGGASVPPGGTREAEGVPFRPKAVVMMIGTNNTGDRLEDPALTVAGIKKNLDEVRQRQPQATVLLLALFPRGEKPDDLTRRHNAKINELLPALADGKHIVFLDIGQALMNPDGTLSKDIMPDWLHLSPAGYEIWARSLEAPLSPLLAP